MNYFFTAEDILKNPHVRSCVLRDFTVAARIYEGHYQHFQANTELVRPLLHEAVASAYCDICRLTVFRGIKHADIHKQAAFLVKWIAKLRPIHVRNYPSGSALQYINEAFAVTIALTIMAIHPNKLLANSNAAKYADNLLYLLHYNTCAPEQLASELFLLEQCLKSL
jgi:hypothetical protein